MGNGCGGMAAMIAAIPPLTEVQHHLGDSNRSIARLVGDRGVSDAAPCTRFFVLDAAKARL